MRWFQTVPVRFQETAHQSLIDQVVFGDQDLESRTPHHDWQAGDRRWCCIYRLAVQGGESRLPKFGRGDRLVEAMSYVECAPRSLTDGRSPDASSTIGVWV